MRKQILQYRVMCCLKFMKKIWPTDVYFNTVGLFIYCVKFMKKISHKVLFLLSFYLSLLYSLFLSLYLLLVIYQ